MCIFQMWHSCTSHIPVSQDWPSRQLQQVFMRKSAVEAGIIDHSNSPNLLLCLEPEGASIQCREDAEDSLKERMLKDTVVLVLDCGGGTVDITVHKLMC